MSDVYTTDDSWMENVDFTDVEQRIAAIDKRCVNTFNGMLGIRFPYLSTDKVVAELDISPRLYQPFGFLHGGVTLALIESAASRAADMRTDFSKERPFGVHIEVDHKKPGKQGVLRATAVFDHQEKNKQIWNVEVRDEGDDIVSDGIFITKIVSLERLAEKERERERERERAQAQN